MCLLILCVHKTMVLNPSPSDLECTLGKENQPSCMCRYLTKQMLLGSLTNLGRVNSSGPEAKSIPIYEFWVPSWTCMPRALVRLCWPVWLMSYSLVNSSTRRGGQILPGHLGLGE